MAHTLVQSYLYARPKVGYARNRSRTACFNEGFLKQAILGSKKLAEKPVDIERGYFFWSQPKFSSTVEPFIEFLTGKQ